MSDRWTLLADQYLAERRVFDGEVLNLMKHEGGLSGAELAIRASSRARFAEFLEFFASGSGAGPDDLEAFRCLTPSDIATLKQMLYDIWKMHFVKVLAEDARCAPPALLFEMVRGAVYTIDPSANRVWIDRTIRVDPRRVCDTLLWFLENGTSFEVGGAANAFYWFDFFSARTPEIDRAEERRRLICLTSFVKSDDLDLRRCLVGSISWDPSDYRESVRGVLEQARAVASVHTDDYIRQRFLYDTGKSIAIPCLPHRDIEDVEKTRCKAFDRT